MESAEETQDHVVTRDDATQVISRARTVPDVSFRAFLAAHDPPRLHWADLDGLEVIGTGATAGITAMGESRFETVRERANALFATVDHDVVGTGDHDGVETGDHDGVETGDHDGPSPTRPRLIGGFSFAPDHQPQEPWEAFQAASFVLPSRQIVRGSERTWLTVTRCGGDVTPEAVEEELAATARRIADLPRMLPSNGTPGVLETRIRPSKAEWTDAVERVTDRIDGETLRKVVLATTLEVDLAAEIDIPSVLERLRRTYPDCYRFLIQPNGHGSFFGPPPERLVKLDGETIETEALAGSVPRGETPEADADHARSLLEDEKLQHEQRLVVDSIRDELRRFGTVEVGTQDVRKLTNIQHLQTPITGTLDDDTHVLELVEALHPTPAVGGLPRDRALQVIAETETFERGWYAAPVGWFDAAGDGEFAVGIRSGVAADRSATLYAGNGIVADSDPSAEWDEIQPKYRPILDELD
jgi:menaquinone-specific isochorismate synthase